MKKLIAVLCLALTLLAADVFARGSFSSGRSSFSSGRSSYSSGSFSSGRSSFSSGRSSTPSTGSSTSGKSSPFGTSSRGSFGRGGSTSRGGTFGTSSRGSYGSGTKYVPTTREVLSSSPVVISTPYHTVPIYYYYYPTPFYGSGYHFYQWYYWSHFWGNHDHCYHQGGGQAVPARKCEPNPKTVNFVSGQPTNTCSEAETCDLKTHECKLKQ